MWLWSPRLQAATKRYYRWRHRRSMKRERWLNLRREQQRQRLEAKRQRLEAQRRQDWSPELVELHNRLIRLAQERRP